MNRAPVVLKWSLNRRLNAVEVTVRDHLKFESAFFRMRAINRLLQNGGMEDLKLRRAALVGSLREAMENHLNTEEELLVPEYAALPGLKSEGKRTLDDHKQLRSLLKELQPPSISARTFDRKLNQLVESFSQHAHHEEQVVLPLLTRHLSPARLDLLGHQMISSKKPKKMESAA